MSNSDPLPTSPTSYSVYFAGELFSAKHLLGNAALAEAIYHQSGRRFVPLLPQNIEQRGASAHAIRDRDLRALFSCDLALFNYDGPELDSGTVVEFLFAKFADIPAVLLRTDFRGGGDQSTSGDPWNLMTSFYPRTRAVILNAMDLYQDSLAALLVADAPTAEDTLEKNRSARAAARMIDEAARAVISAFKELLNLPPAMPPSVRDGVYEWLALMPNIQTENAAQVAAELRAHLTAKQAKGIL